MQKLNITEVYTSFIAKEKINKTSAQWTFLKTKT